jgi:hypothetical protein
MSTTIGDLSIFMQANLSGTGINSYLGSARQGATYPLITHNILASTSSYTIKREDNTCGRIDNITTQVAIYGTSVADTINTLGLVEEALEGKINIGINDSTLMCLDKKNMVGPRWTGKEGYYQLITEWETKMGNFISSTGSAIKSGSTSIPIGASDMDIIAAFGWIPTQIVCNVTKPTPADSTFFASPERSSFSAIGFSVSFSGVIDRAGYTLDYIACK